MSQRFRLFPNSPTARELFNKDAIRREWRNGGPVITQAIILICVLVWAVEIIARFLSPVLLNAVLSLGMLTPAVVPHYPWTLITSMFMHEPGIFHLLFNMLMLWSIGPVLERMLGHWRFLGMYLLSGIGGDLALLLWARLYPGGSGWVVSVYGASGALFGLFAAILIVYRRIGADITSIIVWVAINFALPLLYPGIAWQAHVGGFLIGGLYTWLLTSSLPLTRGKSLTVRSLVYGLPLLAVIVAVGVWCLIPVMG
ncbi:rhomboid family intramembrane serine protease [Bifidobacterium primatium]|uniref:Rhomboid family intramembrane serine protease n=2 Tax=Bifidobacterium TaxID=1678 RepID=A0A2M9HC15_9BIFI|nr:MULTISPECIES: rhomboid family intramembrane serine protease [Bifidobacterium]NEG95569.1 rhomboid family intramembrane serine protease [Bifidobacterium sp. SMB2]NEH12483.1 rhomboid family intramembrane serine protease [Bifidobacterium saimiriisciurei]PJM74358.1 rhomboid family intramembrane serine protease [Bifidobacterium primatium]